MQAQTRESAAASQAARAAQVEQLLRQKLEQMPVADLKRALSQSGISHAGMAEKSELIEAAVATTMAHFRGAPPS